MASMNCPNCARQISDNNVSCPGCGYALPPSPTTANTADEGNIISGGVFDFGIWKLLKYEISDSGWTRFGGRRMYTSNVGGKYGAQTINRIDKTKGQILKIWLLGLFGTLGFHYFAAGRLLTGLFHFLWGAIWWVIAILCAFDSEMQKYPNLIILFFVLLLTPSLFCFFTKIIRGRFRDVFQNYIK